MRILYSFFSIVPRRVPIFFNYSAHYLAMNRHLSHEHEIKIRIKLVKMAQIL